jgi:RimJ/RimL family protein N-acetyltransferase
LPARNSAQIRQVGADNLARPAADFDNLAWHSQAHLEQNQRGIGLAWMPDVDVALYRLEPEDLQRLWLMYIGFEPKAAFQGLPPAAPLQIREWLEKLQRIKAHQFVIEVDNRIVGHSMLCPGPRPGAAELAIFLHQKFRGLGLGRTLLLCTLNYGCKQLELARVWLSVQGCNARAQRLFDSVGFERIGGGDPASWELTMERPLHCEKCQKEECAIYRQRLPKTVRVRRDRVSK